MNTDEKHQRLATLRSEYTGVRSLLEMMVDNTPREYLEKMRREKLKPLEEEIWRLETEIQNEAN